MVPTSVVVIAVLALSTVVVSVRADADPDSPVQGATISVSPTTPSPTEPIVYEEATVERFFDVLRSQLRCGYPMFGVPSLVPLKLSYTLKTSFDLLSLKKINIVASNFTVHGLNDFGWDPLRTSFTRTSATVLLTFPNVTASALTTLNGANGTSFVALRNATVRLDAQYEEKDDLLYVTDLGGSILLEDAKVKIASLFPKSGKLSKIWNKAIGKSLPILVELFNGGKLKLDYLSRLLSSAKFYAINTINNALNSHSLNFDRLVESMEKFSNGTPDSLRCDETAAMAAPDFVGFLRS